MTKRGYLYCNGVAAVGELFRRVGKLTQQWCPRESGKRKRRGHDTRRRRAARGAYVQSSFWNKKPQRGHISACTWVRERCNDPTESPRSPETAYYTTRILHYAHITLRAQAALGAKLSLAAASSGEPVYTRRIEVLFKLRVVALRARRILFSLARHHGGNRAGRLLLLLLLLLSLRCRGK